MKEFGIKNNDHYYVVYPSGKHDEFYEKEKEEIIRDWNRINENNVMEIMEECFNNTKPYDGIPLESEGEILAIVVNFKSNVAASFIRIMPKCSPSSKE